MAVVWLGGGVVVGVQQFSFQGLCVYLARHEVYGRERVHRLWCQGDTLNLGGEKLETRKSGKNTMAQKRT